jgi:hypothetical protein
MSYSYYLPKLLYLCFHLGFQECHFYFLWYRNSDEIFILILSKFRRFDFPKFRFRNRRLEFGFDCDLFLLKWKFRRNFILIWSKFRCRNRNFDLGFDFDIGILILISISEWEWEFWFRHRTFDFGIRNFDYEIGIPLSVPDFDSNVEILKPFCA